MTEPRERLFVNLNKRTIITDINPDWVAGYHEERKDEGCEWSRSLHSDWVFARIGDYVGERAPDDEDPFPCPRLDEERPALIVGGDGESLHDIMNWPVDPIRMFDKLGAEALKLDFQALLDEADDA